MRRPHELNLGWTIVVSVLIAALLAVSIFFPRAWYATALVGITLIAWTIALYSLARGKVLLAEVRLRAVEKLLRARGRELTVYAEAFADAHNQLRELNPNIAAMVLSDLQRNALTLHALGVHLHRQEHRADTD